MEKNGEIIVTSENNQNNTSQEIIEYTNFARVDFDNPITMMNYGKELIDEIGKFIQDAAKMREYDNSNLNAAVEKIDSIFNFNEELDEVDKNQQLVLTKPLKRKLSKIKAKILGKDDEENLSYAVQYDKKMDDIKSLAYSLEQQKNKLVVDVNIDTKLIDEMRKYIKKLKYIIAVGESDLEEYKLKIETLRQDCLENPTDEKTNEIASGDKKIAFFSSILNKLREKVAGYYLQIQQDELKQQGNMELTFIVQDYIGSTIPTLIGQVSSMVGVRIQKNTITQFNKCVDNTNKAIQKNAELLTGNIQEIGERAKEGNITTETYEKVTSSIEQGYGLLEQLNRAIQDAEAKKSVIINDIIDSSEDRLANSKLSFLNENMGDLSSALETHTYSGVTAAKTKQKRFKFLGNGNKNV